MAAFSAAGLLLSGCVNQNAHTAAAGEADELRIVATSPAVVDIMARLDIDLVGVPNSTLSEIPARYDDATRTGTAMGPDMEVIKTLNPDWVIGPASLQTDMEPKLEAAGLNGIFLNLESVEGLYKSVEQLVNSPLMEDFSPVHQSEIWQNKKIFSIFTVGGLLKSYNQPKTIITRR